MRVYNVGMTRAEVIILEPGKDYILRVRGNSEESRIQTSSLNEPAEPSFRDLLKGLRKPLTTRQRNAAGIVRDVTKMIGNKAAEAEGAGVDELLDLEDERFIKLSAEATRAARLTRRQIAHQIVSVFSRKIIGNEDLVIERAEIVYNALRGSVSPKIRQLRG